MAQILVVEDDRHISRVIKMWLTKNGHKVICAYDGNSALDALRQSLPDLVITDVNLPGRDGLELLDVAHAESLLKHRPIVLTSRCDQAEITARAEAMGAAVHPKPFSPMHLMEGIEAALSTSTEPQESTHLNRDYASA